MKTCLVTDDSKVIRTVAKKIAVELGFQVDEAADGREALAACRKHQPDVILLDWNMPVMNGIEFLRALPTVTAGVKPVVIFCTTESSLEHIQEALEAGADEYIMKPFDRSIIESKFRQVGLLT